MSVAKLVAHLTDVTAGVCSVFAVQTVLVTGAGGFAGAGLCQRLGGLGVRHLILLEHHEESLYRIDQKLASGYSTTRITPVLGDVGNASLLDELLALHHPDVVFHTAAFKHVPLLESQAFAAVRNNVLGTHALIRAAAKSSVRQFVSLSTDKVVNPISVMGASKRITELMIQATGASPTRFTAVRLGNILGSPGSVVPRFRAQIRHRQPITLTHPEATRYFVTRSKAVDLLLRATILGEGGDILVPDLAPAVRILDLACALKRTSADVPIVVTGLRPGERLSEELWRDSEIPFPTSQAGLLRIRGPRVREQDVERWIAELSTIVGRRDVAALRAKLCEIVPEYQPSAEFLATTGLSAPSR